jgi:hypothetical protein
MGSAVPTTPMMMGSVAVTGEPAVPTAPTTTATPPVQGHVMGGAIAIPQKPAPLMGKVKR